jgi:hypothetical protein
MHDFLRLGAFLASETEGDQQAKLRSFGDAFYAPCLSNDNELYSETERYVHAQRL